MSANDALEEALNENRLQPTPDGAGSVVFPHEVDWDAAIFILKDIFEDDSVAEVIEIFLARERYSFIKRTQFDNIANDHLADSGNTRGDAIHPAFASYRMVIATCLNGHHDYIGVPKDQPIGALYCSKWTCGKPMRPDAP
ncbi:hypothetical protein [Nocardia altamirensis]|uniref:hypothetical protein n=1 Tax=Nocardia altamirensis TaxID=472158 RepID=UPI00084079F3|nr:hypothetical protein [Nocardia altamirensis]